MSVACATSSKQTHDLLLPLLSAAARKPHMHKCDYLPSAPAHERRFSERGRKKTASATDTQFALAQIGGFRAG